MPIERLAVMASADAQCLAKPAGTRTDETDIINTSARAHQVDTSPRFKGSDEDCRTRQANRVQAPVNAIGTIHISQSRGTEHTAISRRLTLEAMGGRIIEQIGLGFYDNAAHSVKEQFCADQFPGDINRASLKKGLLQFLNIGFQFLHQSLHQ